jgi:Family of unknown function (DUF6512)
VGEARRLETIGALVIVVVGTFWHFVYDATGTSWVVGLIAPVNESVWEHLKLVLVPILAYGLVESIWLRDPRRLWWAKLIEIVAASTFIVVVFYTYTGALGIDSVVAVDISSFVIAVLGGQWLSYRILTSRRRPPTPVVASILVLAGIVVAFAVLTHAPPHVPLFEDTTTHTYGPG